MRTILITSCCAMCALIVAGCQTTDASKPSKHSAEGLATHAKRSWSSSEESIGREVSAALARELRKYPESSISRSDFSRVERPARAAILPKLKGKKKTSAENTFMVLRMKIFRKGNTVQTAEAISYTDEFAKGLAK